jgi:Arm DNA-binding domain
VRHAYKSLADPELLSLKAKLRARRSELTVKEVEALRPAPSGKRYDISDPGQHGFGIRVNDRGEGTYVLATRFPGATQPTRREIGKVAEIDLTKACATAKAWLAMVKQGVDPKHAVERQRHADLRKQSDTFEAVAELWLKKHAAKLRSGKFITRIVRVELIGNEKGKRRHRPGHRLGARPIGGITKGEVKDLLQASPSYLGDVTMRLLTAVELRERKGIPFCDQWINRGLSRSRRDDRAAESRRRRCHDQGRGVVNADGAGGDHESGSRLEWRRRKGRIRVGRKSNCERTSWNETQTLPKRWQRRDRVFRPAVMGSLLPAPPQVETSGVPGLTGASPRRSLFSPGACTHKLIAEMRLGCAAQRPLLGVKRTWRGLVSMSANDR